MLRQLCSDNRNLAYPSVCKAITPRAGVTSVVFNEQKEYRNVCGCGFGLIARRCGSICVLQLCSQFPYHFYFGTGIRHPSDVQVEGKSGLDGLFAPPPAGSKGVGLIEAYQKDPQRFKRYAEMLDTATNAKQVGDLLLLQAALHPPRTSESLLMDTKLKVDALGNPFCIIPVGERMAVVSGGPSHLSCDALPLSAQQIAASNRSLYAGPSDVVVVIVMHRHDGQPVSPQKPANGPGME